MMAQFSPIDGHMNWHFNVFHNFDWVRLLDFNWVWLWDMAVMRKCRIY